MDSELYAVVWHPLGLTQRIEEMEAVGTECESNCNATFTIQIAAYKKIDNLNGSSHTWRRMEKSGLNPPPSTSFSCYYRCIWTSKCMKEAADTCFLCGRAFFRMQLPYQLSIITLLVLLIDGDLEEFPKTCMELQVTIAQ
ncbi:hypothetical protein KP509_20G009900 [Ceratopteris richardii]|uniref:Uncharacterized protein n=1 Tax=Ceratopteris richardii TaxID=49495 RepID=A0A8T2SGQ5_CERRI|nr:hypothetical protein KP509_20G009900 [Ceratopteris richardii]